MSATIRPWNCVDRVIERTRMPEIMGILNVTPDSFSDGGQFESVEKAVAQAMHLVDCGAGIIDVGGESTRPGAEAVGVEEEQRRVIPVIAELARCCPVPISIDTTKSAVAAEAVQAGAVIINDVSGLTFDPEMIHVAADTRAGVCCMHIQGTPQTMQDAPEYDDVVADVLDFLSERLETLEAAGVERDRVIIDPGIGFGKTAVHNVELLRAVAEFQGLGRPVLIGHSRKRFLKHVLGREVEERLAGTIGVSIALAERGADVLRVHDVQAVADALTAWDVIRSDESNVVDI